MANKSALAELVDLLEGFGPREPLPPARAKELGYWPIRTLPTGEQAGVMDYLYTGGLVVGLDTHGWRTRFCYETRTEAEAALQDWDGTGDPPGMWIKQKPEDRYGPGTKEKMSWEF